MTTRERRLCSLNAPRDQKSFDICWDFNSRNSCNKSPCRLRDGCGAQTLRNYDSVGAPLLIYLLKHWGGSRGAKNLQYLRFPTSLNALSKRLSKRYKIKQQQKTQVEEQPKAPPIKGDKQNQSDIKKGKNTKKQPNIWVEKQQE